MHMCDWTYCMQSTEFDVVEQGTIPLTDVVASNANPGLQPLS